MNGLTKDPNRIFTVENNGSPREHILPMIGMGLPRIQILFLLMETIAHQGFTYSLLKGWAYQGSK